VKAKTYLALLLAFVLAVGLVAVGCGTTTTTAPPATTGTTSSGTTATTSAPTTATTAAAAPVAVKIGAAGPFTGQLSKIGQDTLNAIKYAVDQYNAAQTKVKVTIDESGDDAADPAKAAAVAEKFSSDTAIVGVIGPMTSAGIQAAEPVLEKGKLPMITQSGTNDKLSQQGFTVFHRICPVDAAQGAAVAGIIGADLKAKKVVIIDDKGTYGVGLADQVQAALKAKYGFTDDAIQRVSITADDKDFSALITKMKAFTPDALFAALASPAQYAAIAKQMVQASFKTQLVGADGVKDKGEFIDNAAGATEGCYFTSLGPILETSTNPAAMELVKVWTEKYGSVSMFTGQSFEATNVLLDAITRAYDANGGKVDRAAVSEALKTTNYTGVLGFAIQFQANGDLKSSGVFIGQVKNGQFTAVKEANY
jgi:branched-chain amino acid transport system substrate-binding protein